jgi:RimJ/RimL family protein N-acetyltransferase
MPPALTPPTLHGRFVRLEPLSVAHAADLSAAVAPDTFEYFPPPYAPITTDPAGMAAYITARTAPGTLALAIIDLATGRAVGSSCFLDIRPAHSGLEIGATFIAPAYRGKAVNPESKLLMLAHAFDTLGCARVQLKCDARNTRSQRAIEKLGAVKEGVLRKHMAMPEGFLRDTVMYSIIQPEWPAVKARLNQRLSALA